MPDVLIHADTERSPEMRHEVPVSIPDPFFYGEHTGTRFVAVTAFETARIREVAPDIDVHPFEDFGVDELLQQGLTREDAELEIGGRLCERFGIRQVVVPATFPLATAETLRGRGIEVTVDRALFDERRRVKTEAELAGIRRAQRGAEAGMAAAAELLKRAEPNGTTVLVDGEPLTCERLKVAVERAFSEHEVFADSVIVSHGAQTAIGHEPGSGPIAPGEPVILDLFPRDRGSGCFADMTRTFVVGDAPEELLEYQRLCREALDRAVAGIRPGVDGRELHRETCRFFEEHGYPTQLSKARGEVLDEGFYHGLGHGVGLEVHEAPGLGRGGHPLVAGDVVAVEPGLYRQGFGGCRLEDIVLVTPDGAEVLTRYPYELAP